MDITKPLGMLASFLAALAAVGAAFTFAAGPLTGQFAVAVVVVSLLLVVAVGAATRVGSRSSEWLESGGYW